MSKAQPQDLLCYKASPVTVDFHNILTRKGFRCMKNTDEDLINQLIVLLIIHITIADRMAFFLFDIEI